MTSEPQCTAAPVPSPLDGFLFIRDWLAGENRLRQHLPDFNLMAENRLADLSAGTWQPWTAEEVAAVAEFNHGIENPDGARLAEVLSQPDALVIVTGQQPNLVNAPLYILHKALSAVAWSRKYSAKLNRPVTPVFWVASDDDDFAELKQAWHVAFDGSLVDIGAKASRGYGKLAGTPAYSWDLQESAQRLLGDLESVLSLWTNGPDSFEYISHTLHESPNFETFFCRLMVDLLGPEHPMVFIAPRLLPFRARQVELLRSDLKNHAPLNTAINDAAQSFEANGYPVSLHREPEALNFFWISNGVRHKLIRRDGEIVALDPHRNAVVWKASDDELADRVTASPEEFAPNVVTRPVLQDMVLPTIAYIAGPGEIAYLALLGEAYRTFKKSRAAVIPRTFITMMPSCEKRRATCLYQPTEVPDAVMNHGGDTAVELLNQINVLIANANRCLTEMQTIANGSNPAVTRALEKTESHIRHGVEQLKRRLAKQVAGEEWRRASRLASIVAPAGSSQERMLSPWNFVKAGEWDALSRHLAMHVDYTAQEPQTAPLPGWIEADL